MYCFFGIFTDIFAAFGVFLGGIISLAICLILLFIAFIVGYAILAFSVAFVRESFSWLKNRLNTE